MLPVLYAQACNEFAGAHFRVLGSGQHSFFWRNVAAMASRWQNCVRFNQLEIWASYLPLQRRSYLSTNWLVWFRRLSTLLDYVNQDRLEVGLQVSKRT